MNEQSPFFFKKIAIFATKTKDESLSREAVAVAE